MNRARAAALRSAILFVLLLVALAHASGLAPWRAVGLLDLAIGDARLRAGLPDAPAAHPGVAVVQIDARSVAALGRWPWSRTRIAELAELLFGAQQAAVVGFDIVFAEPESDAADGRLAQALAGRRAVLGLFLAPADGRTGSLPPPLPIALPPHGAPVTLPINAGATGNVSVLAQAAAGAGFLNLRPDIDGNVRSLPLVAVHAGQVHGALPLAMLVASGATPVLDTGGAVAALRLDPPGRRVPVDAAGAVRVPFELGIDTLSAVDLLSGRVPAGRLAGRMVIVGVSAAGAYDLRPTPVAAAMPGVQLQARTLAALLGAPVRALPDWARGFEVVQLLGVAALLLWLLPRRSAAAAVTLAIGLVVVLLAANAWADAALGLVLPVASALLLAAAGAAVVIATGYVVEGRQRRAMTRLFGAYVPPELVAEMARDPDRYSLRAENRTLSLMFCDIRGFTALAEGLPPERLRELVNRFFTAMTRAIRAERGTLDKYIGDALMAFWGAPVADADHARRAVRAALAMAERLPAINAEAAALGLPAIGLGIGLNTGEVCVGDMGSEIRRSYTVMGDAVNLASRIEGLTRHYGLAILAGERTRVACGDADVAWIEVDRVRVKGRAEPVTLFTPLSPAVAAAPGQAEDLRHWQLALAALRGQHWDEAQSHLAAVRMGSTGSPLAPLVRLFGERIQAWRDTPPPSDWDGTTPFDAK